MVWGMDVRDSGSGLGVAVGVGLLTAVVGAGVNVLTAPADGAWTGRWWVWVVIAVLVAVVAIAYLQARPARKLVVRAVAAADNGAGTMEVLVASAGGAVLASAVHEDGTWEPWTSCSTPGQAWDVAVVQPSHDTVEYYVVDRDGAIRGRRRDRGSWTAWRTVPLPRSGHARVVRLTAASLKGGHRELYVVLDNGRLMHSWKWDDSSTWSEWHDAGVAGIIDVAACSPKDDLLELFAVDRNGDLWHRWYWEGAWHPWGNGGHPGSPLKAVTVFRRADDFQELFAAGKAGDLWHQWHRGGEPWSDWAAMETPQDFQDVAGATTSAFHLWCLAVDKGGQLWQRSYDRGWAPQWRRVGK